MSAAKAGFLACVVLGAITVGLLVAFGPSMKPITVLTLVVSLLSFAFNGFVFWTDTEWGQR